MRKISDIERALAIALSAHRGQVDKAGRPYILHPMTVASRMGTDDGIITALLHDVVEDTEFTIDDLDCLFSSHIIEALELLTHEKGTDYFEYILRIKENPLAKAVKIQDLLHNSDLSRLGRDITKKDLQRQEKYAKAILMLRSDECDESHAQI